MRLAIVASHPVQYYTPLFRGLAERLDLTVFYGHHATQQDQAEAGFGVGFEWDIDLLSGYRHEFLQNVAAQPGLNHFAGVDTPEIGHRLRVGRFDAVLLMGWFRKCYLQALWAAKRLQIPVLVRGDSHLDTPRTAWRRLAKELVYPIFLRSFDGALVVGERNRAYWRHYRYPESRMFDSPHCVDNEWFASRATHMARSELRARLGVTPDVSLVLFVGKLVPIKRPIDLVEAVSSIRATGIPAEILIAGTGPLEMDVRTRARTLDVPLHMLGFCNQTEMPAAYAASEILVLPSESETWGLVANEALACGKPIVVSDAVGCAPDMAARLGDRAVFRVGDMRDLARTLQWAIKNPPDQDLIASTAAAFSVEAACTGIEKAAGAFSNQRRPQARAIATEP